MKKTFLKNRIIALVIISQLSAISIAFANGSVDSIIKSKSYFVSAKEDLSDMLTGKNSMSYEQAVYLIENAYRNNQISASDFKTELDFHTKNIKRIIDVNRNIASQDFKQTLFETSELKKENYEKALTNWAIFSYITDTTVFAGKDKIFYHLPYHYSTNDPLGTLDWSTTQVSNLLYTKSGNCFALASLFKIFSERLNSNANLCTAPGHIYIRHADTKGILHNVELSTSSFPGTGSIETLTHTTNEATINGISLRMLNLKESVALSLVYLAKGYEYKFKIKDDEFMLQCAEMALQYDSLNLNAMLLKAEVMEQRLLKINKGIAQIQNTDQFKEYEKLITHIFQLGYREMPLEMKNFVIARIRNDSSVIVIKDYTPQPFKHLGVKNDRYATLSWGLFDEMMVTKMFENYHQTVFDTQKKKITKFIIEDTLYNKYPIDMVVFAMNIDPLYKLYPGMSPYAAFADNPIYYVDTDGQKVKPATNADISRIAAVLYSFDSEGMTSDVLFGVSVEHGGEMEPVSTGMLSTTLTNRAFERNLRNSGLSREQKADAKAIFKLIKSKDIIEVGIVEVSSQMNANANPGGTPSGGAKENFASTNPVALDLLSKTTNGLVTNAQITATLTQQAVSGTTQGGGTYGFFPEESTGVPYKGVLLINPPAQASQPMFGGNPAFGSGSTTTNRTNETKAVKAAMIGSASVVEECTD